MARSKITNQKKLARFSQQVGFPVIGAMTRGNTDHRIDVWGEDRIIWCIYKDGQIARTPYHVYDPLEFRNLK